MTHAVLARTALGFAVLVTCCGTEDSDKDAGEACSESSECRAGLTCPKGECEASCDGDNDCTPIGSSYRCNYGLCRKMNPYTCTTDENTPFGNCSCARDFAIAGSPDNPCTGLECCAAGVTQDPDTFEEIPSCYCVSTAYLSQFGHSCEQYISGTAGKKVSKCPP